MTRKNRVISIVLMSILVISLLAGCGSSGTGTAPQEATTEKDYSDLVADKGEMIGEDAVVLDGMKPIEGKDIKDGTYPVEVLTSSHMFPVNDCNLIVKDGKMTAVMTMDGKGYLYLFMGTGLDAAKSDESAYIPFEEDSEGKHTFTIPVEALNAGLDCAAFSKRKGKWYNRKICVRADSLPMEAFADGVLTTAKSLGLKDGNYTCVLTLGGGTGRAEVESPAVITVKGGECTATIVWSSPNYDYMLVDGQKYDPVSMEEHSVFEIPVKVFDMPMAVVGDTIAMSEPHEIDYTMTFDSSTITEK